MWQKWFPWRFIVRHGARAQGFLDPIHLLTQLQRFSQPSEVMAPTELLRAGAVLQARGLMNSQAIQHNLDWVWPYWVERQFNPKDDAFVPRAFNLTHINLTHRNWTAVGIPDVQELALVDPRGLVTPHFDGWSIDAWIITEKGVELIACRLPSVDQKVSFEEGWAVETRSSAPTLSLFSRTEVVFESAVPVCRLTLEGLSDDKAWLVVSLRPYNPEGVSFIHTVEMLPGREGWKVNGRHRVDFDAVPDLCGFSYYRRGDVHRFLQNLEGGEGIDCRVGMATAAALFEIEPKKPRHLTVRIPLRDETKPQKKFAPVTWKASLQDHCELKTGHSLFKFLYDAAVRTLVLHSPDEVYPGPYTYKRFWFRDAAFILHAMLCVGFKDRVERAIDRFPDRQTPQGYFLSQEGEWDSNGEALWIMRRFCEMTGKKPKAPWRSPALKAGHWIQKKRLKDDLKKRHAGLLPAGFSAEHLGPNDFYYWDDFWGVAGLRSAAYLSGLYGDASASAVFDQAADHFFHSVHRSVNEAAGRLGVSAIPASPYRRMDAGAIGSLSAGYPLRLYPLNDVPLLNTADFLMKTSFFDGGFFQQISHSGVNPYLSLHVAQVLLRAGDMRFFFIMDAIAWMASPTGQWPEAIHPRTGGGCMGDGQHVWAAAEWILMVRNSFVCEEEPHHLFATIAKRSAADAAKQVVGEEPERLVLCRGLVPEWYEKDKEIFFGRAPTSFGDISISVKIEKEKAVVSWEGRWFGKEPMIEIRLPGFTSVQAKPGETSVSLNVS